MEYNTLKQKSRSYELFEFVKLNYFYILLSILAVNAIMIYAFINKKDSFNTRVPFIITASTDAGDLLCDGNKSCWNEIFFSVIKTKFPSASLINGLAPEISMSGYDTVQLRDLHRAVQSTAESVNTQIHKETQMNISDYENKYPKELLSTDYIARRYIRTQTVLKLYSEGGQLPVTVGEQRITARPNNFGVWISSGTIFGALLGSGVAFGLGRLRRRN